MNTEPAILRGQPHDDEGPVFRAPWEAQAFAMAVSLHRQGLFSWSEWANALGRHIAAAQAAGDADLGDTYYLHWLDALEDLVTAKGASSAAELLQHRQAWDHAAHRTPHGRQIELRSEDFPRTWTSEPAAQEDDRVAAERGFPVFIERA